MSDATAFVTLFRQAAMEAMLACMAKINPFQTGARTIEGLRLKADDSIVTLVDEMSEDVATKIFTRLLPDTPLLREESGILKRGEGNRFEIWIDPVDGTRPLRAGIPGSTVIFTLYDRKESRIAATLIGNPLTGQILVTASRRTVLSYIAEDGARQTRPVQVWDGEMNRGTTLFIDNIQGFPHGDKQILTDAGCSNLWRLLGRETAILNPGSNGLHHAAVALGNDSVVGAITTAQGGPWDCGGALSVIGAGGVARGLYISPNRHIVECDPLNPLAYDMLVVANNTVTLRRLIAAVYECI